MPSGSAPARSRDFSPKTVLVEVRVERKTVLVETNLRVAITVLGFGHCEDERALISSTDALREPPSVGDTHTAIIIRMLAPETARKA
jgi:hypothetical protein